jgi:hypothetical protein
VADLSSGGGVGGVGRGIVLSDACGTGWNRRVIDLHGSVFDPMHAAVAKDASS